ncbi:MAG: hypothetical protein IPJ19_03190 [Planctomycetes bacterium]|nr:hypothetical protein [Planctomycetota bacterium]
MIRHKTTLWIPCLLGALGLHLLVASFAGRGSSGVEIEAETADFQLVLSAHPAEPDADAILACPEPIVCARPYFDLEGALLPEVEDEIERLGPLHAWAGDYLGATLTRLSIAPVSGFWFARPGRTLSGRVYVGPNTLDLQVHGRFESYFAVHWGERRYLVRDDDWREFESAIERGEEPRRAAAGKFLLREGDERLAVEGTALRLRTRP